MFGVTSDTVTTGAAFAVALALVEVIKILANKIKPPKSEAATSSCALAEAKSKALMDTLRRIEDKNNELWDCHLGPRAIDPETSLPRWWGDQRLLARIDTRMDRLTELLNDFLEQMKVERQVRARLKEAGLGTGHAKKSDVSS